VTQPSNGPVPAGTTGEPVQPGAPRNPAVEDLDVAKDVKDADADRVKGGVKKTMQT
jgi:hypothetical protein